ncbi:hypothetical protein [Streptomyces sp. KLOTTS4A1]|uniref:hypothetical protein n=1 Tax=Streptomyces sp. KLOTTS4A1 TaxID=3390996 RepID=UPI0039F46E8E
MSSATFTPAPVHSRTPAGATATDTRHTPRLVRALRAVKVFAGAAVDVVILGDYEKEAGVTRHRGP